MEGKRSEIHKIVVWDCIQEGTMLYWTDFNFYGWMTLLFGLFAGVSYLPGVLLGVFLYDTNAYNWLFVLVPIVLFLLFLAIGVEVMVLMYAHHRNQGTLLSLKETYDLSKGKVWTYIGWKVLINLIVFSILLIPNLILDIPGTEAWSTMVKDVLQLLVTVFVSSLYAFAPLVGILDYEHEGHLRHCRKLAWPYIGKLCMLCGSLPLLLQIFSWSAKSSYFIALPSELKISIAVVLMAAYVVLSLIMTLALYRAYCHVTSHQEDNIIKDFSCLVE